MSEGATRVSAGLDGHSVPDVECSLRKVRVDARHYISVLNDPHMGQMWRMIASSCFSIERLSSS